MGIWLWVGVLVLSVFAAYWGAEQLADLLRRLRQRWGLTEAAGAAFIALATASPEVGVNLTAALRGAADIGLGNMLGANIIPIPLVLTVAYVATRLHAKSEPGLLRLERSAVTVHALPYIGIVLLVAALTLPAPWRGLQPVDAWIMLGAYFAYAGQAVLRGREQGEEVEWTRRGIARATAGALVLAASAYAIVRATENIVSVVGIDQVIGGLFITAPMSVIPEAFATWSVIRSGDQETTAGTGMIADNAVTLTLAFVPLGLVGLPIDHLLRYVVNLGFVLLMPIAYVALIYVGTRKIGFALPQLLILDGLYLVYIGVMVFGILGVA